MKLIAFILSLVMLSSTIIPCSVFDNCEEEAYAAKSCDDEDRGCKDCSPFSVCSAAVELYTVANHNVLITPAVFVSSVKYSDLYFHLNSEYYSSLFQPPRHA